MRTSVDLRFEKGDPVREYWLARGEGFAVETRRGRVVGEVVDVVVDPADRHVVSLVVRRTLGTSEVPADEIQAVVPARDAFVLDGAEPEERQPRRRRRPSRLRPALSRAGRRLAPFTQRAGEVLGAAGVTALAWAIGVARWTAYAVRVLVAHGRRRLGELVETRRR
jgi:PRC-barrel domain